MDLGLRLYLSRPGILTRSVGDVVVILGSPSVEVFEHWVDDSLVDADADEQDDNVDV
jgi:hypothetical protein